MVTYVLNLFRKFIDNEKKFKRMKSYVFPGNLSEETLKIGKQQIPYMRTTYFSSIMLDSEARLLRLLNNPKGRILFYTASGTGAMDSVVRNFVSAQSKALILVGGSFGQRWKDLCDYYKVENTIFKVPFAKDANYNALEEQIIKNKPKVMLCQHHETSSGQVFDLKRIGQICKKYEVILVADVVSSFLTEHLDMKEMNIDICLTSSQKGLDIPPGISLVAISERALSLPKVSLSYYFDFDNNLKNLERGQTPFSPATTIFLQLHQRLEEIEQIGLENIISKNREKALYFRSLCKKYNWEMPCENPANCITSFFVKQNGNKVFEELQEKGIYIMPNGSNPNFFRVSHTGIQDHKDLDELANNIYKIENKNIKHPIKVFTSGSFDLFHLGHLNILEKSAALGDELIVSVSTDELIENYKGIKPIIPYEQRVRTISALKCVTKVIKQTKLTDIKQLKEENIDIVTIGDDWKNKYLEGLEWMKAQENKKVVYFPYTEGISTTSIKKKIIDDSFEIIQASIDRENKLEKNWREDKYK